MRQASTARSGGLGWQAARGSHGGESIRAVFQTVHRIEGELGVLRSPGVFSQVGFEWADRVEAPAGRMVSDSLASGTAFGCGAY